MPPRTVSRTELLATIQARLGESPIVAVLGPRQCGKTTVARWLAESRKARFFDLEAPADRRALAEPMTALEPLAGTVVIDEAQLRPDLFSVLRVLADRKPLPARFVLTGSASPDLVRGTSESLAGRVGFVDMGGFDLGEVGVSAMRRLWARGGFPRSFLATSESESRRWRDGFVQTFLERDLRQLGINVPPVMLGRLWQMLAHYHGQVWNASEIGRSLGEAHTTIRRHLDILTGALVVRQLQPWFQNLGKRVVKSPKVYIRDSGLLHALLGIDDFRVLEGHPKLGASWEGFAVEEILRLTGERQAWFWGTQGLSELDLLVRWRGRLVGFEMKYKDAPAMTKSLHAAMQDLKLEQAFVVYPGTRSYRVADNVEVLPLGAVRERLLVGRGR
jgi:predicted AAA+ superfamily ATPase